MNQFAQTLLHQANDAIEAGETAQAMDLLRKAKVLAGADDDLAHQILSQMIRIAPACNCEAEAALWQRQLAQTAAPNRAVAGPARPPVETTRRFRNFRAAAVALGLIAALALLAFAFQRFWNYSASRFNVASTQPHFTSNTATRPI